MKIYRVIVRGQFADLDDDSRSTLLTEAPDHHFLRSAFTRDGTLTYDEQLVAFNFRYEVRDSDDELGVDEISDGCIGRSVATLASRGIQAKHLRSEVTDMASMWER